VLYAFLKWGQRISNSRGKRKSIPRPQQFQPESSGQIMRVGKKG